jgi:hypothetical protein
MGGSDSKIVTMLSAHLEGSGGKEYSYGKCSIGRLRLQAGERDIQTVNVRFVSSRSEGLWTTRPNY